MPAGIWGEAEVGDLKFELLGRFRCGGHGEGVVRVGGTLVLCLRGEDVEIHQYTRYIVQLELECNLEGMMINVLVYVVGMEQIKSIAKWNALREGSVSVHSNKMGRTNNGIKMNYVSNRRTVFA